MPARRQLVAGALAALLLGGTATPAGAGDDERNGASGEGLRDPATLVAAMSRALRTLNYEGTFVHLQGTHASSMRILHANDGGGELERMVSLDGEAREVIRNHSLVTCIWPGSQSVVVSKSKPRELLPSVDAALASNPNYALAHAGTDRVAGVPTEVVEILPHDRFRYGYRFWVDRETSMLLRSMLLDGARTVEQLLFTAIDYPDTIDRSRFDVAVDDERISWIETPGAVATVGDLSLSAASGAIPFTLPPNAPNGARSRGLERAPAADGGAARRTAADEAGSDEAGLAEAGSGGAGSDGAAPDGTGSDGVASDRVRFASLPSGYAELSESYREMPLDSGGPVSHVMVSDGMASVSVYVEHVEAAEQDTSAAGLSSMGAMNAYGLSLDGGFVTVVGEVPPATVQTVAEAVRLVD